MKKRCMTVLLLLAALMTGCSQSEPQDSQITTEAEPALGEPENTPESTSAAAPKPTEAPTPSTILYVTDHSTAETGEVSSFLADLAENGYVVETDTLASLSEDTGAVILNAPSEDITSEELAQLDSYMDEGGCLLLLLPADEQEMRYKYLEILLEEFCLTIDYDVLQETQSMYTYKDDADYIQMSEVTYADGMNVPEMHIPAFQRNARSFGMVFADHYGGIRQDVILRSNASAVGVPCGGTEDDPETFEDMELMTMVFSRDDRRANSTVVAVGSADFLLDENYTAETSTRMKELVFASVEWLIEYVDMHLRG